MIKIVGVRFRNAGKVYYFDPKDFALRIGDHVIVETSKGPEYGVITTGSKMVADDQVAQPLREVLRTATDEDEELLSQIREKEKEALKVCREKVREHELDMKVVGAEYAFDGSKMLFYFTADGRVDFRELVKDLAGVFHMRIELRQIGVRDETRMLGGIGTCGRELCCATYLREFQPVSIKMAKEQNLSLNPAKISGTCGRLMCCLKNEEETYEFLNARMPKLGSEAITADRRSGKVVELDVLRQRVRVLFEEGDSKELEYFPVEELTFQPRKKKDPSAQGQDKAKDKKNEKGGQKEDQPAGRDAHKADADQAEGDAPVRNGKNGSFEKSRKDSSQENGGRQNRQSDESGETSEKKKPRRKKNRQDGAGPSANQGAEKNGSPRSGHDRSGADKASENADKAAAKKRRRHKSRRPAADSHGDGGNKAERDAQTDSEGRSGQAGQAADTPRHTSEMRIYADRGSQND